MACVLLCGLGWFGLSCCAIYCWVCFYFGLGLGLTGGLLDWVCVCVGFCFWFGSCLCLGSFFRCLFDCRLSWI